AIAKVRREQPGVYLRCLTLLVPREHKVEHSNPIKDMTDEQLERGIELIKEMRAEREAGANAKVIEGVAKPVPVLPPPSRKARRKVRRRSFTATRAGVATARFSGNHFAGTRVAGPGRGVFGNRVISNAALQSRFGFARFHGRFFGSPWPWWWGGLAIGWIGPVFWPYVYYDFFDYVFWPYAYDDFWPYAYDDVYYGIYGPYAYGGPGPAIAAGPEMGFRARGANTTAGRVASAGGSEQRVAEVCSNGASDLTDWPIARISEVVQPAEAQRPALDDLRAASQKAIDILKAGCPNDLPSTPIGRLAAMENRLKVMLQAGQPVPPPRERF